MNNSIRDVLVTFTIVYALFVFCLAPILHLLKVDLFFFVNLFIYIISIYLVTRIFLIKIGREFAEIEVYFIVIWCALVSSIAQTIPTLLSGIHKNDYYSVIVIILFTVFNAIVAGFIIAGTTNELVKKGKIKKLD